MKRIIIISLSFIIISCGESFAESNSANDSFENQLIILDEDIFVSPYCFEESILDPSNMNSVPNSSLNVLGLMGYFEDQIFSRIPIRISSTLRPELETLVSNTSGGILAFRTNASDISISAKTSGDSFPQMNAITSSGIDIYIDNKYLKSGWSKNGDLRLDISGLCQNLKEVEIYLPSYGDILDIEIRVNKGAELSEFELPANIKILYYGSSITQGCCSSNPSLSYPSIIYRKNKLPFINLGFSGQGLGDEDIAYYISEVEPSIIILDFWANPTVEAYRDKLPKFIKVLRDNLPNAYILVNETFYGSGRLDKQNASKEKDLISLNTVSELKDGGDERIFFVSGLFSFWMLIFLFNF